MTPRSLELEHLSAGEGDLTVVNARIFDGTEVAPSVGGISVRAGRIVAVGPDVHPGTGPTVDAAGASVLPGLIDAHFHAFAVGLTSEGETTPLTYVGINGARRLSDALFRGFTTVRDVAGGDPGFARAATEGLFPAPRYQYAGAALSQTGGHGDRRAPESDECLHGGVECEVVDGVDAVRAAVRERFRKGAHVIKIMTSGGVVSPSDPLTVPQYSAEEIQVITAEAARRGSYVAAHAYSPEAIVHSVLNGVRSIEHGNLLTEEAAQVMAEHGAFLVPTLAAYDAMARRGAALGLPGFAQQKNAAVLAAGQGSLKIARAAGVAVGFGTDLMGPLADDQLEGLRLQAEADGLLNTLRSATSVNAALVQRPDLGRIETGAIADLLVLGADVFVDGSVLWDSAAPRTVVRSGLVVSP